MKKLRILAVDDEPNVTRAIKRTLARKGYEVIEVNDPHKVEEYILYSDLSLVITDFQMPGMDGLKVLEVLKSSKPDLPVIFLTGHSSVHIVVEATKGGAADYLIKPCDNETLLLAVQKHARADQAIPENVMNLIKKSGASGDDMPVDPNKILLDGEIISTETIPEGFVEVQFENILTGQFLPFGIYIQIYNKHSKKHMLRKIINENTIFTTGLKNILDKRKLASVFIKEQDYDAYLEYHKAMKMIPTDQKKQVADKKKLVLYGKAVEAVTDILADPADNKNIKSAYRLVDDIFQVIVDDPVTYQDMFKLFRRDTNIFNHSANVCLLSVSFGNYLKLNPKQIKLLGFGGLFHDVGMNRVDQNILAKRSSLTPDEWHEIKKHPERGFSLMKSSPLMSMAALKIILEHHEEDDGSGYPRGLKGVELSNMTRICRIVDKYDGLTTDKPYRKALPAPEALKRIYLEECAGTFRSVITKFVEFLGGN